MENELLEKPKTELTLPQRAAVALESSKHEARLRELVKASADITEVKNLDGRTQAHQAGMKLKNTRTAITNTAKAARDDATDFSKAVIAEEKRLIEIISTEETRVFKLRDDYDAKVEAEKQAEIAKERARVDGINRMIAMLRDYPRAILAEDPACLSSALKARIDEFDGWVPHVDDYAEFVPEAEKAIAESLATMRSMLDAALIKEAAIAKEKADREAENARLAAERAENERQRAELEKQRIEQNRIAEELRRKADAELAAQKAEQERQLAEQRKVIEAQQEELRKEQERLAEAKRIAQQTEGRPSTKDECLPGPITLPHPVWPFPTKVESSPVLPVIEEKSAVAPTMRLGQLCDWLGFTVTEKFLNDLGFIAKIERATKLYHESDRNSIRAAIIRHLQNLEIQKAA